MINYENYILASSLSGLKPIGNNKFNAQCPLCDDSIVRKKRLWFLRQDDGNYIIKCFNAGCILEKSTSLLNFLKLADQNLYNQLRDETSKIYFDGLKEGKRFSYKKENEYENEYIENKKEIIFANSLSKDIFKSIYDKPEAVEYLNKRKIPEDIYKSWYYVFEKQIYEFSGNIVIPLMRNSDKGIYGFNSRNIFKKSFINILFSDEAPLVYNIYNVDNKSNVYIFESVFDSMYINNSVACCGANFPEYLLDDIKKPVFCFDYDETGLNKTLYYLTKGYKVFIFPKKYQEKPGSKIDMNDIVIKNNLTKENVNNIIISNIYEGKKYIPNILSLFMKNRWKMSENNKRFLTN